MYRAKKNTRFLLVFLSFLWTVASFSQVLLKPELVFGTRICDNGSNALGYPIKFGFTTTVFNSDNVFSIELSDANGVFSSTDPIVLGEVRNENTSFTNIPNQNIQIPDGTTGTGYRIRIVATSPAMISPESDAFEAHKMLEGNLILNGFQNATICEGEQVELTLNTTETSNYTWYKDNTVFTTTTEPKLSVSQPGRYDVRLQYGTCSTIRSNIVIVSGLTAAEAQIQGNSVISICNDQSHTFTAVASNTTYTYTWFKDDEVVQTSNSNTYTTPTVNQFGVYRLQVTSGDCTVDSQEVTLQQPSEPDFTVTPQGDLESMLLPCETRELTIAHTATNARIEWYKDGTRLGTESGLTVTAILPGKYVARVIKTVSGGCDVSADSEPFVLWAPTKFVDFTIRTNDVNYEDCSFNTQKLVLVGVKVENEEGTVFDLSDAQINPPTDKPQLLFFQWYKNTATAITNATEQEYTVTSYTENADYELEVKTCNNSIDGRSNVIALKLIELPEVTVSQESNSLCEGSTITYTTNNMLAGYTYQWFKDADATPVAENIEDFEVSEIGTYVLKVTGFGCENIEVYTANVVPFDDSVVQITPSEKVVLKEGETVTVTASGANSYEWFFGEEATGTILSSNETLVIDTLGFYTVKATVGNCEVVKTIEAVEQDDILIVPNVITANGDGVNDTWILSNRYSFQPEVTVIIYNSDGRELVKTNEYKNDWPVEDLGNQRVFYYKILREEKLIKAGTISVFD